MGRITMSGRVDLRPRLREKVFDRTKDLRLVTKLCPSQVLSLLQNPVAMTCATGRFVRGFGICDKCEGARGR